jgi:regulatory protein
LFEEALMSFAPRRPPSSPGERPERRPPRPVTEAYLERAALHYLERFASSAENLRRVLRRKVENRCRLRGEEAEPFLLLIDPVVARTVSSGLVDDRRYAEARVASFRRRGASTRGIRAKLAAKGVGRETVEVALGEEDGDDRATALALARRRKIGPYRPGDRAAFRQKDMAVLARAGFPFDVVREVIDGEAEEA